MMSYQLFVTLLLYFSPLSLADILCPQRCQCPDEFTVYCSSLTLDEHEFMWKDLTHQTLEAITNLTLTGCNIKELKELPAFQLLQYLDISHNQLSQIQLAESTRLTSVKYLNLQGNLLEKLERDSFTAFPNTEELRLADNKLQGLEWDSFRLFKLKRLFVERNGMTALSENILRLIPNLEELDLSGNDIWRVQSSDFSSAQRLKTLRLSNNRIRDFDYDSFAPLYQLELLDLSHNNLSSLPGTDFRQLLGLRNLNFSGNPIEKVPAFELDLPSLQVLDLSYSPNLRVIEAAAFSRLPSLHTAILSHNTKLTFLSPRAFENSSLIFSLDVSHCRLETISANLLGGIAQVKIAGNPLDCGCQVDSIDQISSTTVVDYADVHCVTKQGENHRPSVFMLSELSSASLRPSDQCRPEVILPFGDTVHAIVGTTYSIYCGSKEDGDTVMWTIPNGTIIQGLYPILPSGLENIDYFSSSLYNPTTTKPIRPRLYASSEWLRLDVVVPSDAGVYECSVKRGKYHSTRKIKLIVKKPNINLTVQEIGAHYASLSWNDSLRVQAADRVALHLTISDSTGIGRRAVQLSLHNPWFTYNVMRLRPNQNYTFCLKYSIIERSPYFGSSILSSENEDPLTLIEACAEETTPPLLSFWDQLSWSTILLICIFGIAIISLFCFHTIFGRLHVWQQAKYRSRMNQSISGQSFISHSTSNGMSNSVTYENGLQQTTSLCRFSTVSSNNDPNSARLLTQQDVAL